MVKLLCQSCVLCQWRVWILPVLKDVCETVGLKCVDKLFNVGCVSRISYLCPPYVDLKICMQGVVEPSNIRLLKFITVNKSTFMFVNSFFWEFYQLDQGKVLDTIHKTIYILPFYCIFNVFLFKKELERFLWLKMKFFIWNLKILWTFIIQNFFPIFLIKFINCLLT